MKIMPPLFVDVVRSLPTGEQEIKVFPTDILANEHITVLVLIPLWGSGAPSVIVWLWPGMLIDMIAVATICHLNHRA